MIKNTMLALILGVLMVTPVFADQQTLDNCEKNGLVSQLLGSWDSVLFEPSSDGGWQHTNDDKKVEFTGVLGGYGIKGGRTINMTVGYFEQEWTITCDPQNGTHSMVLVQLANNYLGAELYDGVVSDSSMVFENMNSSISPVVKATNQYFKIQFDRVNEDEFLIMTHYTLDRGETWLRALKLIYTR